MKKLWLCFLLLFSAGLACFAFLTAANDSSLTASYFSDTVILKQHLTAITKTSTYRNHTNIDQLNETAAYINKVFTGYSSMVTEQEYKVDGKIYKNVICSFGTENKKRIIIGAHYDVCGNQEGADDNASGVAGILELARLLKGQKLNYRIDLVAYTLEEPPYFRTENMGSYVHAKSLIDSKADVYGMISLEMIGYFRDDKDSQQYPLGLLKLKYGNVGNYITLVKKFGSGDFVQAFAKGFKSTDALPVKTFAGPASLAGIDFSDHLNYWQFGFDALMITDTSFYRNKNYHQATDKMETLDFRRMAKVIDCLFESVGALAPTQG